MNILFLHKTFPSQFKNLAKKLAKDKNNRVIFISDNRFDTQLEGVERLMYPYVQQIPAQNCHPYLKNYIEATLTAQNAANIALTLKNQGFVPDIIYGFSGWGDSMFIKDVFPDSPFISYYEWYYNSDSKDIEYSGIKLNESDKELIRCKNAKLLIDLYSSDAGICPTFWQRQQFPKEFQSKIKVIHDGIDTEFFKPDDNAKISIKEKNITLTPKDKVITYATRGMEPYRGFPQFMQALELILKKNSDAHVLIAGDDAVCYGQQLYSGSYKQLMLNRVKLDMDRVHFVGTLPYDEYLKLLQVSSAHVYLTYPYVLSWSILEAMSAECLVVASNTEPVLEVIKDNSNGLITDFNNIEDISDKVLYALENQDKVVNIRRNARKTIIENYDLSLMLQKQIEYINSFKNR